MGPLSFDPPQSHPWGIAVELNKAIARGPKGRVDVDREFMAGLSSAGRLYGDRATTVAHMFAEAGQKVTLAP